MKMEKSYAGAKIWVDGRGSRWPDILTCLGLPIFHERVVETITDASLTGFIAHPVEIVEVKIKKLAELPVPRYFLMEITGRVDIDPNELDDVGGSLCPLCFNRDCKIKHPYRWQTKRMVPKLETWDGSDFVRTRNWSTGRYYCTRTFVDLACKNRWTNFVFGTTSPGVTMFKTKIEDYLSYCDPDWFEKTAERVKAKNPDLFE